MSSTIRIICTGVAGGNFDVRLPDGRLFLRASRDPLTEAAAAMLSLGVAPEVMLLLRHSSNSFDALRGLIGVAGQRTIKDGPYGPEFRRRAPGSPTPATASPVTLEELVGMMVPDDGQFVPAHARPVGRGATPVQRTSGGR